MRINCFKLVQRYITKLLQVAVQERMESISYKLRCYHSLRFEKYFSICSSVFLQILAGFA